MDQYGNAQPLIDRRKRSLWKVAVHVSASLVLALVLSGVWPFHFLSDFMVNGFVKGRLLRGLTEAYPSYSIHISGMHYNIGGDRIGFDSVTVMAIDSTLSCTVARLSVRGIRWMHLLWEGNVAPRDLAGSVADAQDIALNLQQEQYEFRCGSLHVSVPDSEMVVEALEVHPSGDDEQFFAGSRLRKTRFRLVVPHVRVIGLACLGLLQGKNYRTRSVHIDDAFLDVLVNKDKVYAKETVSPPMPDEILSSVQGNLQIDSLSIRNGCLKYAERFAVGGRQALITLDSTRVLVEGIANRGGRGTSVVIRAEGRFMKAGTMTVRLSIPVASPQLSFQYSGSLGIMDLRPINSFVETAEQIRIKTGILHAATFEINVDSGRASGNVRATYRGLTLAVINKQTGSDKGFLNSIVSFIARTTRIRGTNVPDKSGSTKIGQVKYTRQRNEYFLEFAWFALRSGVGDVVGF